MNAGFVAVIELASGQVLASGKHGDGFVGAVAFAGERVVSATGLSGSAINFVFRTWTRDGLAPIGEPVQIFGASAALAVSPDGTRAAVGNNGGRLLLIPLGSSSSPVALAGQFVEGESEVGRDREAWFDNPVLGGAEIPVAHQSGIRSVAFSPDGTRLYSASAGKAGRIVPGKLRVWDTGTNAELSAQSLGMPITDFEISSDGRQLLTGGWGGRFDLWEPDE
jgi:WD40 repeat protein